MRIAHVTATFPPYAGGTGNVAYHNALELARRNHDVHVFTALADGLPEKENINGMQVHRLKAAIKFGNASLLTGLLNQLTGFDIIHLHYPFISGAEFVRYASRRSRTPLFVTIHNDLLADGARGIFFRLYQRLSARLSLQNADQLCVVSGDHFSATALASILNGSMLQPVELPNGVDTAVFSPGDTAEIRNRYNIPETAELGLFVAALDRAHHFKGLGQLLEAWTRIDGNGWLIIVGDGDLRAAYEKQSQKLGISDRTLFAGKVANQDLAPFYRAADVTILPSSPPESFGLVLIESLACATPVIASNIPGVRTVVAHGKDGFLVDAMNPVELSDMITRFLNLPQEQRDKMGRTGRERVVASYDWGLIGERLESIYTDVLFKIQGKRRTREPVHPYHDRANH